MIRDGNVAGRDITIYESATSAGGSLDGQRLPDGAYSLRGGRMLTTDHYECTWDLLSSIPSLSDPTISVHDEVVAFNVKYKSHSQARLVDRNRHRVDVAKMGFSLHDRLELLKLFEATEDEIGMSRISDWLSPSFFETNFWLMWQTTFAFQPWHSATELKRYLHRFINEFPRIETLGGVKRTPYNQYDAIVRPLVEWLRKHDVNLVTNTRVADLETETRDGLIRVTALCVSGSDERIQVQDGDLVFLQNGSMTDASSLGTMTQAPPHLTKEDSSGWSLWESLAKASPDFGNPAVFNACIPESYWASFTTTCTNPAFFEAMEAFSGNRPGTGGLVTFKDSSWRLSIVLYHQPHFIDQPGDVQVFWGYALQPERIGDYVAKPMAECGGMDILKEICGHLKFDPKLFEGATCIPCRMPYITSMFMPREITDRPLPVPRSSENLAFISQFVEIADDVVFTVEYSIRAAQIAVYQLLGIKRGIPAITRHDQSIHVMLEAMSKAI